LLIRQDGLVEDTLDFATRILGLSGVRVIDVEPLMKYTRFHIETEAGAARCLSCEAQAVLRRRRRRTLVDVPRHGEETRLVWHQRIWRCPNRACTVGEWTEEDPEIAVGPDATTSARYDRAQQ
jgi:transposase